MLASLREWDAADAAYARALALAPKAPSVFLRARVLAGLRACGLAPAQGAFRVRVLESECNTHGRRLPCVCVCACLRASVRALVRARLRARVLTRARARVSGRMPDVCRRRASAGPSCVPNAITFILASDYGFSFRYSVGRTCAGLFVGAKCYDVRARMRESARTRVRRGERERPGRRRTCRRCTTTGCCCWR